MDKKLQQGFDSLQSTNFPDDVFSLLDETRAVDDNGTHIPARFYRLINHNVVHFN